MLSSSGYEIGDEVGQSVLGRRRRRSLGDEAAQGAGRLDLRNHPEDRLAAVGDQQRLAGPYPCDGP